MFMKIVKRIRNEILHRLRIKELNLSRVEDKNFTIISQNCIGGSIYKDLSLPFNTPTIGLFIFGEDFFKLCSNLKFYLSQDIEEIHISKWNGRNDYPIGLIAGDIEIHFLHYDSFELARKKWLDRSKRVNFENVNIIMTDRDFSTYDNMKNLDALEYNTMIFSAKNHQYIDSLVFCEEYSDQGNIGVIALYAEYLKFVDVIAWLNKESHWKK